MNVVIEVPPAAVQAGRWKEGATLEVLAETDGGRGRSARPAARLAAERARRAARAARRDRRRRRTVFVRLRADGESVVERTSLAPGPSTLVARPAGVPVGPARPGHPGRACSSSRATSGSSSTGRSWRRSIASRSGCSIGTASRCATALSWSSRTAAGGPASRRRTCRSPRSAAAIMSSSSARRPRRDRAQAAGLPDKVVSHGDVPVASSRSLAGSWRHALRRVLGVVAGAAAARHRRRSRAAGLPRGRALRPRRRVSHAARTAGSSKGLTQDDFEIFEDGKPQTIETSDFITFDTWTPDAERRDPRTQQDGYDLAADPTYRVFVIVVDRVAFDMVGRTLHAAAAEALHRAHARPARSVRAHHHAKSVSGPISSSGRRRRRSTPRARPSRSGAIDEGRLRRRGAGRLVSHAASSRSSRGSATTRRTRCSRAWSSCSA